MTSGDGLVVRVRPYFGQFSVSQLALLCDAAQQFGNGELELTNRANIQLRGLTSEGWEALMPQLVAAELVDEDPELEGRRNIQLTPFWQAGDMNEQIYRLLCARLAELPDLPAKVGFVIDAASRRVLADCSADFRVERSENMSLLVRVDGREQGIEVDNAEQAVECLVQLAQWFVESGGLHARRAAKHTAPVALANFSHPRWVMPIAASTRLQLNVDKARAVIGFPFGRVAASVMQQILNDSDLSTIRVTPWRRLLLAGRAVVIPPTDLLMMDEQDPRTQSDACPGAPRCEQASIETLALANQVSHYLTGTLHVSGCSKGCARQQPADLCLVGEQGRINIIEKGRADSAPQLRGLTPAQVIAYLEKLDDSRL